MAKSKYRQALDYLLVADQPDEAAWRSDFWEVAGDNEEMLGRIRNSARLPIFRTKQGEGGQLSKDEWDAIRAERRLRTAELGRSQGVQITNLWMFGWGATGLIAGVWLTFDPDSVERWAAALTAVGGFISAVSIYAALRQVLRLRQQVALLEEADEALATS